LMPRSLASSDKLDPLAQRLQKSISSVKVLKW